MRCIPKHDSGMELLRVWVIAYAVGALFCLASLVARRVSREWVGEALSILLASVMWLPIMLRSAWRSRRAR